MDFHENSERVVAYQTPVADLHFLAKLYEALQPLEERLARETPLAELPILLIGGVQRSGTTLLYQLLANHCRTCYINNLVARFSDVPLIGLRLSRMLLGAAPCSQSFTSEYGVTPGPEGPHEFGYFWTRWLKLTHTKTHFLSDEEAARVDWEGLARCLRRMTAACGVPLVLKNPIAAFNGARLLPHVPQLRFLLITRDPFFVIQSTYLARKKRYGDTRHWWSLKPPSYQKLQEDSDPLRQVVGQVLDSLAVFTGLQERYRDYCFTVSYQEMRQRPEETLEDLANKTGLELTVKNAFPRPDQLPDGDCVKVSVAEERQIRLAIEQWQSKNEL